MWKNVTIVVLTAGLLLGCIKDKRPDAKNGEFDFATTNVCDLNLDYALNGYDGSQIDFEVYDRYPFVSPQNRQLKEIEPILRAYTDKDGRYKGPVLVPIHAEKLFVRSTRYGVPEVVELKANGLSYSFDMDAATQQDASSRAAYTAPSDITINNPWNNLGVPGINNGVRTIPADVMSAINGIFKEGVDLNDNYQALLGKTPVMNITRNYGSNRLTISFVHSDGVDLNSVGYYTYPTANPPASLDNVRKTMVFPNASFKGQGGDLRSGFSVDLKYWDGRSYVSSFPKGTSVGFFVIKDGFDPASGNVKNNERYYSNYDLAGQKQQLAAFANTANRILVVGVESSDRDGTSDCDFNDLIFYVAASSADDSDFNNVEKDPQPQPIVDPVSFTTYKGTLIFEDLWPSRGDYDINDVVIEYTSRVYVNKNNLVTKVEDQFVPVYDGAQIQSGFAYQYNVAPSAIKSISVTTDYPAGSPERGDYVTIPWNRDSRGLETGQQYATIPLFDDIRKPGFAGKGHKWLVTTQFTSPVDITTIGYPPYNPFVVIIDGDGADPRNRELHLRNHRPTDKASAQWFGYGLDRSVPSAGKYYISTDNYPFAIHIPIHSFALPAEGSRIEDKYPRYHQWAVSHGAQNSDWYLHPAK